MLPIRLGEDQGLSVATSVMPADVQQGVDFPLDLQSEAVDEAQLVRTVGVIEGQVSAFIVQEESHPAGRTHHRQDNPGGREGFIDSILQANQPHSALWILHQLGLTIGRSFDQPQTPFRFVTHLHLDGKHQKHNSCTFKHMI